METRGLFFAGLGAVVLFVADWQNAPVRWIAGLLFVFAALIGFSISRWRIPVSVFLSLSVIAAEWSSEHLKVFKTDLSASAPNLFVIAIVGFVLAYTACLMGGGVRSLVDAGTS